MEFPRVVHRIWAHRASSIVALVMAVLAAAAVGRWVDLTPRVEGEFFFADDDPQLQASRQIRERFRLGDQVILRVRDPEASADDPAAERDPTLDRLEALGDALLAVEGVDAAYSAATHDLEGPLYGRILSTPDPTATNVVLQVDGSDPQRLVPRIEGVVDALAGDLEIVLSGAPVIVEWIRRNLLRDLIVFTSAAALIFALLVGLIYRDPAVLVGTLVTSAIAVNVTLLMLHLMGVAIGLLTANLATIVFVLTLSHMVFITANTRRAARDGIADPVPHGVAQTFEGSFWGMTTTLLGFLSLLVATARPLRELGIAGAVGTVIAMVTAYKVYPAFLAGWARLTPAGSGPGAVTEATPRDPVAATGDTAPTPRDPAPATGGSTPATRGPEPAAHEADPAVPPAPSPSATPATPNRPATRDPAPAQPTRLPALTRAAAAAIVVGTLFFGLGVLRLDTDPGLLSYFASDTPLRDGLEQIDLDGGSSPLYVSVRNPDGSGLDNGASLERLEALQSAFEADERIGVTLGPAVLIEQARTMPLARFLPISVLLDIASSPRLDEVALGFVTAERDEGLMSLRMRESVEVSSRDSVIADVDAMVRSAGLEPVLVAGLYDLQARLGHLIAESLGVGIGGLLLLFLGVAAVVSRSVGSTARMWLCLAVIPMVVLGVFGWLGIAVDIITSPAANVALAVGVDSMIHLVVRARRFRAAGAAAPWSEALDRVRAPVLAATGILGTGFGIFVLSSFPPTRRFGLAVIVGTAAAAALALVVLPRWSGGSAGAAPAEATAA